MTSPKIVKINGNYHIEGRPRESFQVLAHHRPSNIPGRSLIVGLVDQPPNAASPPHTHGGAAVVGCTISGSIINQMNNDSAFEVGAGETWYEAPGCHHVRGENASDTERCRFFAVFVVDDEVVRDGYEGLVVIDQAVVDEKGASD